MNTLRSIGVPLVLSVLAGMTLALPAPAGAESMRHRDARHDVVRVALDGPSDAAAEPAPRNVNTDILRVQVNHRRDRVTSTLTLRKLPTKRWVAAWEIRTDTPQLFQLDLFRYRGLRDFTLRRNNGQEVTCPGLDKRIDPENRTIRVSVPRTCLGDPHFVRVGAGIGIDSRKFNFADDSLRDHGVNDNHTKLGPKLHRG